MGNRIPTNQSRVKESLTPGLINALNRGPVHRICSCGMPLPVYPGRYPSKCPHCGQGIEGRPQDAEHSDGPVELE